MKIFHAPGSRSLRVLWFAEEAGVPYEIVAASPFNPSPEFRAVNPTTTLPCVIDGDVVLTESMAIIQYLADKHQSPLAVKPGDARYADYLQFMYFGEASLAAFVTPLIATRFRAPDDQKDNFTAKACGAMFKSRMQIIDRQLDKHAHMAGGDFTLADISVGYALQLGSAMGLADAISLPAKDYLARLQARPAYQRAAAVK
jgi:glutathione S-transferase